MLGHAVVYALFRMCGCVGGGVDGHAPCDAFQLLL